MNRGGRILADLTKLLELFASRCEDRSTLDELVVMTANRQQWTKGHDLFNRIRKKALAAERSSDATRLAQYAFEEACAKTLYNLSSSSAPFDPDSPYWVVPNALLLARRLGLADSSVLAVVAV